MQNAKLVLFTNIYGLTELLHSGLDKVRLASLTLSVSQQFTVKRGGNYKKKKVQCAFIVLAQDVSKSVPSLLYNTTRVHLTSPRTEWKCNIVKNTKVVRPYI